MNDVRRMHAHQHYRSFAKIFHLAMKVDSLSRRCDDARISHFFKHRYAIISWRRWGGRFPYHGLLRPRIPWVLSMWPIFHFRSFVVTTIVAIAVDRRTWKKNAAVCQNNYWQNWRRIQPVESTTKGIILMQISRPSFFRNKARKRGSIIFLGVIKNFPPGHGRTESWP